jgi:hypothetical protein
MEQNQTSPSNLSSIIGDFSRDLSITFPEYAYLWEKWTTQDLPENEINSIEKHCMSIYPERFFDILYQNDDIFKVDSEVNTIFLPNIDFKLLYNCDGISENTKKTMWKYLQLILFSVVGGVKDKSNFGETMNLFEGIDEKDLHDKLNETMGSITDFFKNIDMNERMNSNEQKSNDTNGNTENTENTETNGEEMPNMDRFKSMFENMPNMPNMPNMENLQDHLKNLFEGKIGKLAKEMAEEISEDFSGLIDDDMKNSTNTQDVLKKLMKNPTKIMELMKKVGGKLDAKMKSGEISREEIMKEAGDLLGKMKDMGGKDQFNEMFKNLAKNMGGAGKNMRLDTNALDRITKQASIKERMKTKLEMKKMQQAVSLEKIKADRQKQIELQNTFVSNYSLETTNSPNNFVFRLEGEGNQEKSFIHPDILKELEAEDTKKDGDNKQSQKKKNNKNKKNKKK